VYRKLPAAAGSRTFSALALGLPTSLSYDVRILPAGRSGAVAGQASPTSLLAVNDGLAPDGASVDSFDLAGASSVVAADGPDGSSVVSYDPATGRYGKVIAWTGGGEFYVFGTDPAAHTVLVDYVTTGSDGSRGDDVLLYSTRTGAVTGSPDLSGYALRGGVVDAAHGRADLLATDAATGADTVIAVSMTTGAVTTATDADAGTARAGSLDNLAVDDATGEVYVASGPGSLLCFGGGTSLAEVNPAAGTATVTTGGTNCDTDLAADPAAARLVSVNYRAVSVNFAGSSSLVVMPEADPSHDSVYPLRTGGPDELAVDPVHHLALVLYDLPDGPPQFGAPGGIAVTDSNAMSVIDVVSTTTGHVVKTIADFSAGSVDGYPFGSNAGIQLDPATRTGYMFAPGDDQVQQFSY